MLAHGLKITKVVNVKEQRYEPLQQRKELMRHSIMVNYKVLPLEAENAANRNLPTRTHL
jgi:hypothetical protein